MTVPDYISPIIAYRVWQWDDAGLKSLNGELWVPRRALAASCRVFDCRVFFASKKAAHTSHDAPKYGCTCGIYASKSPDHLRRAGYAGRGIHGEVLLWGAVVEHEHGWRAQFAYPKTLCLPSDALPVTLAEIQSRLRSLVAYRCDISIAHGGGSIPLWRKDSGLDAAGLEFLMRRGKEWYARRKQEATLKPGDRVAILGRGTAVVEHADWNEVQAILGNRERLRLLRKDVLWNAINSRWEAASSVTA